MARYKVLMRIDTAIKNSDKADLDWADIYCTLRVRIAPNDGRQKYWLEVLEDVRKAQMQLN
jgi:hypothetical protein